jgi:peptidyl-prolyl cis-trans isomerase A (cyclophilin A)
MRTFCVSCALLFGLCVAATTAVAAADPADSPMVVLDTTAGPITVQLDRTKAPITVDNFLKYVDSGFFDGLIFHRVIPGFMIQGGGMNEQLQEKATGTPIRNESGNGLSNRRGTIAMARTDDPNSATAQFFINLVDNTALDSYGGGYAVFGKVIGGMDVVDKIAQVPTGRKGPHENVPVKPVVIKSARRKPSS